MSGTVTVLSAVEAAAWTLLDAMHRQHGQPMFSPNVDHARHELAVLLDWNRPAPPDDESRP